MILTIGKKQWAKNRFIHIDKVAGFKLLMEDGTEYPISKEDIEFVMGTPEQYDASKIDESPATEEAVVVENPPTERAKKHTKSSFNSHIKGKKEDKDNEV